MSTAFLRKFENRISVTNRDGSVTKVGEPAASAAAAEASQDSGAGGLHPAFAAVGLGGARSSSGMSPNPARVSGAAAELKADAWSIVPAQPPTQPPPISPAKRVHSKPTAAELKALVMEESKHFNFEVPSARRGFDDGASQLGSRNNSRRPLQQQQPTASSSPARRSPPGRRASQQSVSSDYGEQQQQAAVGCGCDAGGGSRSHPPVRTRPPPPCRSLFSLSRTPARSSATIVAPWPQVSRMACGMMMPQIGAMASDGSGYDQAGHAIAPSCGGVIVPASSQPWQPQGPPAQPFGGQPHPRHFGGGPQPAQVMQVAPHQLQMPMQMQQQIGSSRLQPAPPPQQQQWPPQPQQWGMQQAPQWQQPPPQPQQWGMQMMPQQPMQPQHQHQHQHQHQQLHRPPMPNLQMQGLSISAPDDQYDEYDDGAAVQQYPAELSPTRGRRGGQLPVGRARTSHASPRGHAGVASYPAPPMTADNMALDQASGLGGVARPRRVPQYKPYTGKVENNMGALGYNKPDLNSNELIAKRQKAERIRMFSRNLKTVNRQIIGSQPEPEAPKPRELTGREKARQYATQIPKPRIRELPPPEPVQEAPPAEDDLLAQLERKHAEQQRQAALIRQELGLN